MLERNWLNQDGRDRDRTDDLYRVKLTNQAYLAGFPLFQLDLGSPKITPFVTHWPELARTLSVTFAILINPKNVELKIVQMLDSRRFSVSTPHY